MKLVPHWHRDTRMTTDLRRALITVAPPTLLVAAWRWRYEIALLAGLAAILTAGIISVGVLPTIAVVTAITLAVLIWPPARQFVLDRAWCIMTAHRCTRRLRRSNDLLQPRQDSHYRMDSSPTVRRTSPAVVPSRHQHRRLRYQPSHTHVRMLGTGHRCPSRPPSPTPCHPRRHTPTALQRHQRTRRKPYDSPSRLVRLARW
jgi:hypothetical protein